MTILFFDTETSGLPIKGASNDDQRQPHIVQLAACLTDDDGKVFSSINTLIKADGWKIDAKASETHGISEENCITYGVSEKSAIALFCNMAWQADVIVGHNVQFDLGLIKIQIDRMGIKLPIELPKSFCTMEAGRDLCKIPPTDKMKAAGFTQYKSPKLSELYKVMFGEELIGAHDAMIDVNACKRCYFELIRKTGEAIV